MKYSRFEEVPVWKDAVALARHIYELTSQETFRKHSGLQDQFERAGLSVSNNIAEGFERGTTKELLAFLYIARGSAGEVRSMLCVLDGLLAFHHLKSQIADLKRQCQTISRQLYGWIESLKNSDITGQRHLTNQAKTRLAAQRDRQEFLAHLQHLTKTSKEGNSPEED